MRAKTWHFLPTHTSHIGAIRWHNVQLTNLFDEHKRSINIITTTFRYRQSNTQRFELCWQITIKLVANTFMARMSKVEIEKFARYWNDSLTIFIETNLSVGDRVIVSSGMGSRAGILQYIGETKFAPGNWCGVQLDEPSGKNDGTVDGVQYVLATNKTRLKKRKNKKNHKNSWKNSIFHFRYFNCPPNYGIFVPLAKVSLSPLSRKSRLSRAGSKESLNSIGTMGSITSTNTSRLRMSAQVPLTTTTYHVVYSTY